MLNPERRDGEKENADTRKKLTDGGVHVSDSNPAFDLTRLRSLAQAYLKEIEPPDTTITYAHAGRTNHKAVFAFTGSGGFPKLHFQCKLDARAWTLCASPETYTSLKKGKLTGGRPRMHILKQRA